MMLAVKPIVLWTEWSWCSLPPPHRAVRAGTGAARALACALAKVLRIRERMVLAPRCCSPSSSWACSTTLQLQRALPSASRRVPRGRYAPRCCRCWMRRGSTCAIRQERNLLGAARTPMPTRRQNDDPAGRTRVATIPGLKFAGAHLKDGRCMSALPTCGVIPIKCRVA